MNITTFDNLETLYTAAADNFVAQSVRAIEEYGKFTVALSGGSSPKAIFQLLATESYSSKIDWSKVFIFWVDERWVPLTDDRSNAKMTFDTLLNLVPVPENQIFTMYQDGIEPQDYAVEYEKQVRSIVGEEGSFDFILLGMGEDGHTASLFPGEDVLNEQEKWVSAYFLAPQDMFRITLTAPLINKAKHILLVAFGAGKKHALHEILYGEYNPATYPLQLIQPLHGKINLFTDKAALGQS
jgi:6-phosphogluconolactonase